MRKGKVVPTWKMNDESDPIRPHFLFSLSPFSLLSPSLSFLRPAHSARVFVFAVCVCLRASVRTYASVLEQVRRRLKSRQPGGRRCSKGFRLVPPTRTASVVAVHPRAGAGQIKRARADNRGHRAHRETRARKAERWCSGKVPGRRLRPSVHASKTVSWQGNSLEDDTPATSSSWSGWVAGRLFEKKERGVPVLFFDAVRRGSRTGI